jgi:hypothetical protein
VINIAISSAAGCTAAVGVVLIPAMMAAGIHPAMAGAAVFAGTWGGLAKSTDGGQHWQWLTRAYSGPPGTITAVAVAPDYATSRHVLAGGGWGAGLTAWGAVLGATLGIWIYSRVRSCILAIWRM